MQLNSLALGALAAAPAPRDLGVARQQMELSLGWHIIVASLGIGLPAMVLIAGCGRSWSQRSGRPRSSPLKGHGALRASAPSPATSSRAL